MRQIFTYIILMIVFCAVIYGSYWLLKNGSYFFFYESMVQETIHELVKPEYLK